MTDRMVALKAMLSPPPAAHLGTSEPGLYPAGLFRSLRASEVCDYPVNPNRNAVLDIPCLPAVGELPEPADLAAITVGRELVPEVLSPCVRAGIPGAGARTARRERLATEAFC